MEKIAFIGRHLQHAQTGATCRGEHHVGALCDLAAGQFVRRAPGSFQAAGVVPVMLAITVDFGVHGGGTLRVAAGEARRSAGCPHATDEADGVGFGRHRGQHADE